MTTAISTTTNDETIEQATAEIVKRYAADPTTIEWVTSGDGSLLTYFDKPQNGEHYMARLVPEGGRMHVFKAHRTVPVG